MGDISIKELRERDAELKKLSAPVLIQTGLRKVLGPDGKTYWQKPRRERRMIAAINRRRRGKPQEKRKRK